MTFLIIIGAVLLICLACLGRYGTKYNYTDFENSKWIDL